MVRVNSEESINLIAFIDLLGMKEASDTGNYNRKIREFRDSLIYRESDLIVDNHNARVFFYSDRAFISSNSPGLLFNYLINIRDYLISNDDATFFKCAVVKGSLGENIADNSNSIVSGMTFSLDGIDGIEAYRQHQFSKPIGIRIANNIKNDLLVNSMHFPVINGSPELYQDLHFPEEQLRKCSLDKIFNAMCISQQLKPSNLERYYYTSLLCTWFQSINLTSQGTNDEQWYLFDLILNRKFERNFKCSNTLIYFYFLILNKIYNNFWIDRSTTTLEINIPDILRSLEKYLLSLKKIEKFIGKVPSYIISYQAKELLFKRLSEKT
jgi:hypothetical protein